MSDRWGASIDCDECGQVCSYIGLSTCFECHKDICDDCIDDHVCAVLELEDCSNCRGTGIGYNHEPRSCGRCKGRGYLLQEEEE